MYLRNTRQEPKLTYNIEDNKRLELLAKLWLVLNYFGGH